jgi:hypothetical protein
MEREIKRNNQGRILSYSLSDSNDTYGVIELNDFVRKFENLSFLQIIPTNVEDVSPEIISGSTEFFQILGNNQNNQTTTPTTSTTNNSIGGGGIITNDPSLGNSPIEMQ